MESESEAISSEYIQGHVGYWCKLEQIRSELQGISPSFRTDDEFLDAFGLSYQYLRRIKLKVRNSLIDEKPERP